MPYRLGVDVGGTFTDLLLVDEDTGETWRAKTPSTPADQSIGVLAGMEQGLPDGRDRPRRHRPRHARHDGGHQRHAGGQGRPGRSGHHRGLPAGPADRPVFVPGGLAGWIIWPKPRAAGALEHTIEVAERVGARGECVRAAGRGSVRAAWPSCAGARIEALTVSLINAFANDAHERRIARDRGRRAARRAGVALLRHPARDAGVRAHADHGRQLLRAADVSPTTCATWSAKLATRERRRQLHVLRSDGGLIGVEAAEDVPVNLLMSGPGRRRHRRAVGRRAGRLPEPADLRHGRHLDRRRPDRARPSRGAARDDGRRPHGPRLVGRRPHRRRGRRLHRPRARADGALRVGPQAPAPMPGPAAYGRGGAEPTVTDANVVLGYLPTGAARRRHARWTAGAPRRPWQRSAEALGLRAWRRRRHHRHRQREHVRRAAAGVGPAGLRSARVRADRLRRRGAAARQRARRACSGSWPVDHPAVARACCAPRRRHHRGARRVGAHLHPQLLRDDARRDRGAAPAASWPTQAATALAATRVAATEQSSSRTRSTCATTARASSSRSTSTWSASSDGGLDAIAQAVRRGAHAAVHLRARRRARARGLRAVVQGRGTGVTRPEVGAGGGRPVAAARPATTHGLHGRRRATRPPSTTGRSCRPATCIAGPGHRHRDGLDHADPARPRRRRSTATATSLHPPGHRDRSGS